MKLVVVTSRFSSFNMMSHCKFEIYDFRSTVFADIFDEKSWGGYCFRFSFLLQCIILGGHRELALLYKILIVSSCDVHFMLSS